jgi:undecaprenyl-diphosphatase
MERRLFTHIDFSKYLCVLAPFVMMFVLVEAWTGGSPQGFFPAYRAGSPSRILEGLAWFHNNWNNWAFYALWLILFAWSVRRKDREMFRFLFVVAVAQLAVSLLLVHALKIALGAPRPYTHSAVWSLLSLDSSRNSMPSGHVTEMFIFSASMALRDGRSGRLQAFLWGLVPAMVGFSRMHALAHHGIDVAAGLATGTLGVALAMAMKRRLTLPEDPKILGSLDPKAVHLTDGEWSVLSADDGFDYLSVAKAFLGGRLEGARILKEGPRSTAAEAVSGGRRLFVKRERGLVNTWEKRLLGVLYGTPGARLFVGVNRAVSKGCRSLPRTFLVAETYGWLLPRERVVVTEFVEGTAFEDIAARGGPLPKGPARDAFIDIPRMGLTLLDVSLGNFIKAMDRVFIVDVPFIFPNAIGYPKDISKARKRLGVEIPGTGPYSSLVALILRAWWRLGGAWRPAAPSGAGGAPAPGPARARARPWAILQRLRGRIPLIWRDPGWGRRRTGTGQDASRNRKQTSNDSLLTTQNRQQTATDKQPSSSNVRQRSNAGQTGKPKARRRKRRKSH